MTIADISVGTSHESIVDRLEEGGLRVCRELAVIAQGEDHLAGEIQDKYEVAVSDITNVVIKPLDRTVGAFFVDDGTLYLDEEPIALLLNVVLREFEERVAANDPGLGADALPELLESVFTEYMLHELRHRTQGIERYQQVQQLKSIAGRGAVSGLDILADRDAAFAYAAVRGGQNSRAKFLASFREALFFSSAYFFKVFPVAGDRHDKIERAIAVLLMAARLAPLHLVDPVNERSDLKLDAPLTVVLSASQTSLAIFKGEPSRRLIGSANHANGVKELVAEVSAGQFDLALERSIRLVATLKDFR